MAREGEKDAKTKWNNILKEFINSSLSNMNKFDLGPIFASEISQFASKQVLYTLFAFSCKVGYEE